MDLNSSSSVAGTLIAIVVIYAISAGLTGLLAARKNRSTLAWAIIGGILFPGTGLLVLLFMSYLCPKCQLPITYSEWNEKRCPRCLAGQPEPPDNRRRDFLECPDCRTMIAPNESKCPKCGWS